MTIPSVAVIDYGVGNLLSVTRALEVCGARVALVHTASEIERATHLVLPGVGAFADGMAGLGERGLIEPIRAYAATHKPFLGICLGMQMMLDVSEEFGEHAGLGLIPGRVVHIPKTDEHGRPHKIPHIGWSELLHGPQAVRWDRTIMDGIVEGSDVYFVHSFMAMPTDQSHRLAETSYHGRIVSGVIQSGNMFGCQFHPERSGAVGLRILKNFCALS